ncbi:hypothetical protein DFJ73DRAFT_851443 [Zopfochytrium polystomum]|nr:hypothetical protein DFJ73DRAFT_851443 [Zopfochytrium polystomum]
MHSSDDWLSQFPILAAVLQLQDKRPFSARPFLFAHMFESIAIKYRADVFRSWGSAEFTKEGFARNCGSFNRDALGVTLKGKTAIVTGANAGLGKVVALELAKKGATVHMVCRDPVRGKEARDEIAEASQNTNVLCDIVDVSRPKDIKEYVQRLESASANAPFKLDILVNNAGILPATRVETPDGLESTFATNTVGTYFLTTLLLPALKRAEGSRVISVSSGGMYKVQLSTADLQYEKTEFNGSLAYDQTKRAQVELSTYWAKQHPSVFFVSMHAGWCDTPGVQSSIPGFYKMMKEHLRTAEQGADTIVWAAASEEAPAKVRNGEFLFDRKVAIQHFFFGFTQAPRGEIEKLVSELDRLVGSIVG